VSKLLAHFVARDRTRETLAARLQALARSGCDSVCGDGVRATVMLARAEDPMRMSGDLQPTKAFDASLELILEAPDAGAQLVDLVRDLSGDFGDLVHPDLSAIQIGHDRVFVACDAAPIRYQYCMRRRHDFSHETYLAYYAESHSRFGIETNGIEGYCQFHIDLDASASACHAAGFGVSAVDSVSELHIGSLDDFFGALAENAKLGAGADEETFVDRAHSVMWLSDVIFRAGD